MQATLLAAPTLIARAAGCEWRFFERALPPHPWACRMVWAGCLFVQWMYPSRTAPGGLAGLPYDGGGAMRRRTISIAEPQQRHCNLGRSLRVGGVTGGAAADDGAPAGQGTVAAGLCLKRNSHRRWRCLQLGWSRPKLRDRRNPLGSTCCSTSHKKCAPLTVSSAFVSALLTPSLDFGSQS